MQIWTYIRMEYYNKLNEIYQNIIPLYPTSLGDNPTEVSYALQGQVDWG